MNWFIVGLLWLVISVLLIGADVYFFIYANYYYNKDIGSYWALADKASTITQKIKYIDDFIAALERMGFAGKHNALFMHTPDNSFDKNLEAIKSLQSRLHQIEKMDIASFEYQVAMQQITAQEMGEAKAMLSVFSGIWWKTYYLWLWDWVGRLQLLGLILLCFVGAGLLIANS